MQVNGRNRTRNIADGVGDSSNNSPAWAKSGAIYANSLPELINDDKPYDAVLEKLIQHWHSLPDEARLLIGDILADHVDNEI